MSPTNFQGLEFVVKLCAFLKILTFDKFTPEWEVLRNSGKWTDYPDYGKANMGYLALQDHGSGVWFKAVKIRSLD